MLFFGIASIYNQSFAQTGGNTTNTGTTTISVIATVNIYNAKIESQNGNVFVMSFDITNRQGVQPDVKYSIVLSRTSNGVQTTFDEHVYDEVLNLGENSLVHKVITYTAPAVLGGDYDLYILSKNESGFPFAATSLGKVTLLAEKGNVDIKNDTCYLTVQGEKNSPHYTLLQGVDVLASENLIATCSVNNNSTEALSVMPKFETRARNAFGDIAEQENSSFAPIVFKAKEVKTISLKIPKAIEPQAYNAELTFVNQNNITVSNQVAFHYVLRGISATIQQAIVDKDSYTKGEIAHVSFFVTGSADSFQNSRFGTSTPFINASIETVIMSGGQACSNLVAQPFTSGEVVFDVAITRECVNPTVSVNIKNNGEIIAQKDFLIKTTPTVETSGKNTINIFSPTFDLALGCFSLLLLLVVLLLKKRFAHLSLLLLILIGGAFIFSPESAKADTIVYKSQATGIFNNSVSGYGYGTVNLDKSIYNPGDSVTVTASFSDPACDNFLNFATIDMAPVSPSVQHPTPVYILPDTSYPILLLANEMLNSYTVVAPNNPGTYYIHTHHYFRKSKLDYTIINNFGYISLPFAVAAAPVVAPFNYNLSTPNDITVIQGSSGSNTVTKTLVSGATQAVTLSISILGLPAGVSITSISNNSGTASNPTDTTTITIATANITPVGTYPITVTGESTGLIDKTKTFNLIVVGPGTGGTYLPAVTTPVATYITNTSATLGATITKLGNPVAYTAGIVYDTSSHNISDGYAYKFTGYFLGNIILGAYKVSVAGLSSSTYYFRGFAINNIGTAYSDEEGAFCNDNTATNSGSSAVCTYTPPSTTHAACSNNTCIEVNGLGTDKCSIGASCTPISPNHSACVNNSCVLVSGSGNNGCTNNTDCVNGGT